MLSFPEGTKNDPKCYVTHGVMGHLDPKQPPVKRKPFAAMLKYDFVQKVELILPEEIYEIMKEVLDQLPKPVYSRVILPLKALLEGEFFNEYIKKGKPCLSIFAHGNILMLSEGTLGVDDSYSLREGILTLHLDKESYERAGIVGKPDGVKGKRGTKPRWVVEINLRLPSMLHGKKGFDRIVYAFKNVLTNPVTWLFHDLSIAAVTPDPLDPHFPVKKTVSPRLLQDLKVNRPSLEPPKEADPTYGADFEDYAIELQEWLALVLLESPRISPDDKIDPFLSRYAPPGNSQTNTKLVKLTWQGFLAPTWAHKAFVQVLLAAPQEAWFAYCVGGFGEGISGESKNCTILRLPNAPKEYILWEVL
ncbi:Ribonuclease P protein subunit p40 [Lachnellula cervina]|uniref:Ribonuclease P protein subunit p40 n=1 Tax=Lachnellula cervina TaxID=1316786 RepID=A0A7D8UQ08_9HELO|nr:Ribonuclease P protein subunit p40 [Lachnellula cervina]